MSAIYALFGGVYANAHALEAVLADLRARGATPWCLGDLGGYAAHPDRAVDRLRAAGVPSLRGNVDHSVARASRDCDCGYVDPRDRRYAQIAYDYTRARTSPRNREWLGSLPEQARFVAGGRRVLLCHGSPRRVNEFLWESTCSDAFLEWLCETHEADVIACSHTGLPWHRRLPSGRRVVNVGAIGKPANDGCPEVRYAELRFERDLAVEFRTVPYDHEAAAREIEAEGLPAEFAETLRTGWWTTCLECLPAKERLRGRY